MVLSQRGVAPQNFLLTANPQSGYAMKLSNTQLLERRQDDIGLYRVYEKQLFEIQRIIWNYHAGKKISDTAEFNIDFGEISFEPSIDETTRKWQFEFSNDLATAIDYIKSQNPDITDEQAEAIYRDNVAENAARKKLTQPLKQPGQG